MGRSVGFKIHYSLNRHQQMMQRWLLAGISVCLLYPINIVIMAVFLIPVCGKNNTGKKLLVFPAERCF